MNHANAHRAASVENGAMVSVEVADVDSYFPVPRRQGEGSFPSTVESLSFHGCKVRSSQSSHPLPVSTAETFLLRLSICNEPFLHIRPFPAGKRNPEGDNDGHSHIE